MRAPAEWVRDLEVREGDDSVRLVAVRANGERVPMRVTQRATLELMRRENRIAATVSDLRFMAQGAEWMVSMPETGFARFELESCRMGPPAEGARRVPLPQGALDRDAKE